MTPFVGARDMARWVATRGIGALVAGLAARMAEDLRRWPQFAKRERLATHTPSGVIELMPTWDDDTYAVKYVNGHPSNPSRGLQTVAAFGVLADLHTGYPLLVAEMTLLTALRTAAVSALAARYLARPDARTMALIGAGSQSEFQAAAFRELLGIERVSVWDTDPAAQAKAVRNLTLLGLDVRAGSGASDAVRGADVVTTCTADKRHAVVVPDGDVGPGTHLNAIGGDCPGKTELDPATVARAAVFVEYAPQTRVEGEIQLQAPTFPVTELWEVVAGRSPGRETPQQVTVFDSVGFAIEDFSALCFLRDEVLGTDAVRTIDLVAEPDDPKDLFGFVASLAPVP